MKIISPGVEFMTPIDGMAILKHIERCGRICYKSEDRITEDSAKRFCEMILKRGHETVIEHCSFTVKFICNRGVSHEIVRHRLVSYSQESTRYCNYSQDKFDSEITVIKPVFLKEGTKGYEKWKASCERAEEAYFDLLNYGCLPEEARDVLPNALKTEIAMTTNIREWRHFLKLRTSPRAHPQMREVAGQLLAACQAKIPILFDDIPLC